MSNFYIPFTTRVSNIPIIIYPMRDLKKVFDHRQARVIEDYLLNLYEQQSYLQSGAFHIVILWTDQTEVMTDIWMFKQLESAEAGYTIDCKTFRSMHPEIGDGITASDGLIMLGREVELEEKLRKQGHSIDDYINGERPYLPDVLQPTVGWN